MFILKCALFKKGMELPLEVCGEQVLVGQISIFQELVSFIIPKTYPHESQLLSNAHLHIEKEQFLSTASPDNIRTLTFTTPDGSTDQLTANATLRQPFQSSSTFSHSIFCTFRGIMHMEQTESSLINTSTPHC